MKRTFSLLLAGLTLLPLTACGGAKNENTEAQTTAVAVQTETQPAETEPPRDTADLPAGLDLKGYTFKSYSRKVEFSNTSFALFIPEEESGEILNDTVFQRNARVEELLNCEIVRDETVTGGQNSANKASVALILAQEDFADVLVDQTVGIAPHIADGYYYNLAKVKNLNVKKSYWDHDFLNDMAIAGKSYMLTGDVLYNDEDSLMMCMFNSGMSKDYQLPDLYSIAREGKWTLDVMEEQMAKVANDLNGDGVTMGNDDVVPFLYINNCFLEPFLAGAGTYVVEHDKDGMAVLGDTAKIFDVYDRITKLINTKGYAQDWNTLQGSQIEAIQSMFEHNRALFQNGAISMVRRFYRDFETDFGMLPIPKVTEEQQFYATALNTNLFEAIVIPVTKADTANTGYVLEALASESYDLTQVFYETCFQSKYTRDKESYEMLNIAREHIFYDMAYYFDFAKIVTGMRKASMADQPIASLWESYKSEMTAEIAKLNAYKDA